MGKTYKDKRDRDYERNRGRSKREFSKKRDRNNYGRNRSADDVIDEYTADDKAEE